MFSKRPAATLYFAYTSRKEATAHSFLLLQVVILVFALFFLQSAIFDGFIEFVTADNSRVASKTLSRRAGATKTNGLGFFSMLAVSMEEQQANVDSAHLA